MQNSSKSTIQLLQLSSGQCVYAKVKSVVICGNLRAWPESLDTSPFPTFPARLLCHMEISASRAKKPFCLEIDLLLFTPSKFLHAPWSVCPDSLASPTCWDRHAYRMGLHTRLLIIYTDGVVKMFSETFSKFTRNVQTAQMHASAHSWEYSAYYVSRQCRMHHILPSASLYDDRVAEAWKCRLKAAIQ